MKLFAPRMWPKVEVESTPESTMKLVNEIDSEILGTLMDRWVFGRWWTGYNDSHPAQFLMRGKAPGRVNCQVPAQTTISDEDRPGRWNYCTHVLYVEEPGPADFGWTPGYGVELWPVDPHATRGSEA